MRDFPVFTTENGVASLIFREVPYRGNAYIRLQSTQMFDAFLKECLDFSLAVGAERVYATGHEQLASYPFHTAIYRLGAQKESIPQADASIFPVTEQTLERFRELYNSRMASVPNSAYMTSAMAGETLKKGEAYFVHKDGELLGIGMLSGNEITALASCRKGAGGIVLRTLCHAIAEETVVLECASENHRAMALYRREGFMAQQEISRWYRIK